MSAYTLDDYHANRCSLDEVGQEALPPSDDDFNMAQAIKGAVRRAGGQEALEVELAKNPTALYQAVLKMGVTQAAKQESSPLPDLESLQDSDIASLSSLDLKRILLKSAGVSKKDQLT